MWRQPDKDAVKSPAPGIYYVVGVRSRYKLIGSQPARNMDR